LRIPITSPDGRRLRHGDPGFLEAYERIHRSFARAEPAAIAGSAPTVGSLAHLIDAYRSSPEFRALADKTRKDYGRYLDLLKRQHGHRSVAQMPREAVLRIRDDNQENPRTANYIVAVLRLILSYAEDRAKTFRLPPNWVNPARRPKRLRTGTGHRPWEEVEVAAFRKRWGSDTLERVLFEVFLNAGQRGGDIAPMIRQQYFRGEIAVAQEKTKERVWIPASSELRAVLDPWLDQHGHVVLFPTPTGRPLKVDLAPSNAGRDARSGAARRLHLARLALHVRDTCDRDRTGLADDREHRRAPDRGDGAQIHHQASQRAAGDSDAGRSKGTRRSVEIGNRNRTVTDDD